VKTKEALYRNLVTAALVDGRMTPEEVRYLARKRKSLRITRAGHEKILKKCRKDAVESVELPGIFSEKVRNLYEIILVCLADGKLAQEERDLVMLLARDVKLRRRQLNWMVADALREMKIKV
jgi:hypothetical protein